MSASLTETSDLINVRQFLSSWDTDVYLQCAGTVEDKSLAIAERMDLSAENVDELEAVCRYNVIGFRGMYFVNLSSICRVTIVAKLIFRAAVKNRSQILMLDIIKSQPVTKSELF